jgi:hypothetical protein
MFDKIIKAIQMLFTALINLHYIFAPTKKDEDKETQDNNS